MALYPRPSYCIIPWLSPHISNGHTPSVHSDMYLTLTLKRQQFRINNIKDPKIRLKSTLFLLHLRYRRLFFPLSIYFLYSFSHFHSFPLSIYPTYPIDFTPHSHPLSPQNEAKHEYLLCSSHARPSFASRLI